MDLGEFKSKYKQHEVDPIIPDTNDVPVYLDLYLLYESPDKRWQKVQALIYEYFNHFLKKYRNKQISESDLIDALCFPEVSLLGFGHSRKGVEGRGTAKERAELIKKHIFDNPTIQEVGIEAIAKMSLEIDNIGPDLLSDMIGNFAVPYLIEYTSEQVKNFNLKTATWPIRKILNPSEFNWRPVPSISLPYFEEGAAPRLLAPRHIVKRLPLLSSGGYFNTYLRYVLKEEKEDRALSLRTLGKLPKVSFKALNQN